MAVGSLLLLIFLSVLFCFQVRETEVVIVTTLGKYSRDYTDPGLKTRLPWPIQNVYRFDKRIRNLEKKYEQTTTSDGRMILIDVFLGWSIKEPRLFLERFGGDVAVAEDNLEGLLRDAKNSTIGKYPFGNLISTDAAALKFAEIEKEMLDLVKPRALQSFGIDVALLGIKQIGLPEGITTKVFARMTAEREQLVRQFKGEGDAEANRIRSEADTQRARILAEADAKAKEITGQAEALVSRQLKVFEQNPELAVFLIKLEALEQALKERATLVLDPRTPPFDLLKGTLGEGALTK
jgi:membrane protease subunit HflC